MFVLSWSWHLQMPVNHCWPDVGGQAVSGLLALVQGDAQVAVQPAPHRFHRGRQFKVVRQLPGWFCSVDSSIA
jgi:hypothetical protein